ncbi:Peptidase M54 archaemetzincin [Penicillium capsulatum]|uniref:Peptidase M54 archaemetzincin n=1 Tax=Penicillium capsulatum TaxID=69766 RepID=A0A9W9I0J6_9EURO|nr:Peptidase M54 archaemetzincin [Penicillium capsulatum]KAJ6116445.1 Peptidase M54 archaemetzincin [Penicillium capsulatum]
MPPVSPPICTHAALCLESSPYAEEAGFQRPTQAQRLAATSKVTPGINGTELRVDDIQEFPAPLVLPGDDLAEDSDCPAQSFQAWLKGKHRNAVIRRRRTVYVVTAPQIDTDVEFMKSWTRPRGGSQTAQTQSPAPDDIRDYMSAFYHGLPVETLSAMSIFVEWTEKKKAPAKSVPQYVGLQTSGDCTRIRARPSPDGIYGGQLNLGDLLDAAIRMLPSDAYALILLVDHDLYEDEEDGFVCGRAYGGSRVAVVSSARYNPDLDEYQDIERIHAWPASHCQDYVSMCCEESRPKAKARKTSKAGKPQAKKPGALTSSPIEAALAAYKSVPITKLSPSLLRALWLGRICRTASHELGHCFGIAHCPYYACSMQGTASICEDARQPPYLCPVDLAKVLCATSATESERYHALLSFCERPGISQRRSLRHSRPGSGLA